MSSPPQFSRKVKFGEFELSVDTAELRNNGNSTILPAQPFQVLLALLDRPGELVTRDELKKTLWTSDTFVDFDQSLNKAVNRLRDALADSAEHPRFIETLPKRGYRFVGLVESIKGPVPQAKGNGHWSSPQDIEASAAKVTRPARVGFRRFTLWTPVVLILGMVGLGVARWTRRPLPAPRVSGMVRITNDGWRKFALISDGVRLYFSERGTIFQSSTEGGESTELHTGLTDVDIYDISLGGSELLVASGVAGSETDERPIWVVSLPAGTARRVGGIKGLWACWAPDMEHLAYATQNAIYLAKKDGTEIRKLRDVPVVPWKIQYSPDGSRLRFDGYDAERNVDSIWEMSPDGKKLNSIFPNWLTPLHTGNWTADGRYFFFNTHDPVKDRDEDVWVLPQSEASGNAATTPVQLTKGPLAFGYPFPSADGKKLFVLGTQSRAELARYDARAKQFLPHLSGISAVETEVSHDGKWVVYISYPDLALWRSRVDGTERMQLTFPPAEVIGPRWSPDDTRIAFTDVQPGRAWKIYTIPAAGGAPEEILPEDALAEIDGSWWPDGKAIVFGRSYFAGKGGIQRVDLETHGVSTVPGSEKVFSPRLSPDGTKIAAFREQGTVLMIYDFSEGHWRDVAQGMFQFNIWSRDGTSIYLLDMKRGDEIVRFDVSRAKFDDVASLRNIEQGNRGWVGLAGDDSPLIVRDKSITDVYRLDLQLP